MGYYGDFERGAGVYLRQDYHVVCRDLQLPTCSCRYEMMTEGEEVSEHALQTAVLMIERSRPQPPVDKESNDGISR
jgi:hypothetical protein